MRKAAYTIVFFLAWNMIGCVQGQNICHPDRGIKKAIITAKTETGAYSLDKEVAQVQEIEFNLKGQPVSITDVNSGSDKKRIYKDGKLQMIASSRKKMPDFYSTDQLDLLLENAEIITDTAVVLKHHEDGRPLEMKGADESTFIFEYTGCEKELTTFLSGHGDTLQQILLIYENGVPIESIWTPFTPTKTSYKTKYSGYEFNEQGHWIRRDYVRRERMVTEKRVLTYY